MSVSSRVRDDDEVEVFVGEYLVCKSGKSFRIYDDGSYYSQTSGGVTKRGAVVRDTDWKPLNFPTAQDATAWALANLPRANRRPS